jgi:hypothetical protein
MDEKGAHHRSCLSPAYQKLFQHRWYERDLEALERINRTLLELKGSDAYDSACKEAYEILERLNENRYQQE